MDRYIDWLREAEDDLATALDLLKLHRYSKACFFAQQAAERARKALLMRKAGLYVHTHSVVKLLQLASQHGISVPEGLFRRGELLDRLYVPTRYPNAWPGGAPSEHYNEEDAREAIENAKAVLGFVEEELGEAIG
ncbi:DNA-binding protein [Candidatus Bathyarchaeota archaeon]|nr:MAG: DNA-binding protein [Candidatus Bathyarchaeota archaeon]